MGIGFWRIGTPFGEALSKDFCRYRSIDPWCSRRPPYSVSNSVPALLTGHHGDNCHHGKGKASQRVAKSLEYLRARATYQTGLQAPKCRPAPASVTDNASEASSE